MPEGGRDYASSFCFAVCSILSAPSMAPSIIGRYSSGQSFSLWLTRCRCSLSSRIISGLKYRSTGSPQTLIVALTTITLFLSAQMSSPVTALITSCVICFLPVVFDFNDSLPVLQKMQEICPIFMLHTNGIFSDMKTYFGMSQPVFMIILNVGLIFVFYRLTKNISKKHQVTG